MAVDPLSGTSKPLPPPEILESRIRRPLQFAATLLPPHELDSPAARPPRQRRQVERVPGIPLEDDGGPPASVTEARDEIARLLEDVRRLNIGPTSGDAHRHARPEAAAAAAAAAQRSGSPAPIGSTEWLESRISALIFDADTTASTLDLSGLGMRVLSDKIGELRDMTRLAKRSTIVQDQRKGVARQFKRYTSAPVTTGLGSQPALPPLERTQTPRAVSGPTAAVRQIPRTRSGLHRQLSTTSTASSAAWSRVPSASSTSALAEGESFASTSTAVSDASGVSGVTLVEDEASEVGDTASSRGKAREAFPPFEGDHTTPSSPSAASASASAVSQFRKTHHIPATGLGRAWNRSSSAMTALPSPSPAANPRHGMSSKTVSFANLGVGSAPKPSPTLPTTTSRAGWSRSPSGTWNPGEKAKASWKGPSRGDVQLILSNNSLTCLPSALFQVTNLVVLALRHNQLTELPAAISELRALKELNVSNNKIKTLPPAILDLENLEQFTFVNTELERSPDPSKVTVYPSGRKLEPPVVGQDTVPSLRSIALSVLLSSRLPHNLPPLLTSIDWDPAPEERGTSAAVHGLYDPHALTSRVPCLTTDEARAVIASAKAAYRHSSSSRKHDDGIPNPAFSGGRAVAAASVEETTDDAARNPYFSPCPNPAHDAVFTRKIYVGPPAVERIEWTRVGGADKEVPIKWRGCSAGCLNFLEVADGAGGDDDDGEEGLSDTDVDEDLEEGDGFDADVLGGDDPF